MAIEPLWQIIRVLLYAEEFSLKKFCFGFVTVDSVLYEMV